MQHDLAKTVSKKIKNCDSEATAKYLEVPSIAIKDEQR